MKEVDLGHEYLLDSYDGGKPIRLVFVKREGEGYPFNVGHHPGTNCQEVIRALIARVKYLQQQVPCEENERVIADLRSCLWAFEQRAAKRHGRASVLPWQEQYQSVPVEEQPTCANCGHIGCAGIGHRASELPPATTPPAVTSDYAEGFSDAARVSRVLNDVADSKPEGLHDAGNVYDETKDFWGDGGAGERDVPTVTEAGEHTVAASIWGATIKTCHHSRLRADCMSCLLGHAERMESQLRSASPSTSEVIKQVAAQIAVAWYSANMPQEILETEPHEARLRRLIEYFLSRYFGKGETDGLQRRLFDECVTANWDPEKRNTFAEEVAHLHEELSEAFRAWRRYKDFEVRTVNGKLEGVPIELADTLIGLFYNAELHGFDLLAAVEQKHQFNLSRNYVAEGRQLHPPAAAPAAPSPAEPLVSDMQRDLITAGWVAETAIRWRAPDGSLWRGPYGAWKELQARAAALRTSVGGDNQ